MVNINRLTATPKLSKKKYATKKEVTFKENYSEELYSQSNSDDIRLECSEKMERFIQKEEKLEESAENRRL